MPTEFPFGARSVRGRKRSCRLDARWATRSSQSCCDGTTGSEAMTRSRWIIGAAAVALAVVAILVAVFRGSESRGLDKAVDLLEERSRFERAQPAGETFARVASELLKDGRKCTDDHGDVASCEARLSAAGWS